MATLSSEDLGQTVDIGRWNDDIRGQASDVRVWGYRVGSCTGPFFAIYPTRTMPAHLLGTQPGQPRTARTAKESETFGLKPNHFAGIPRVPIPMQDSITE